jgi:hypothetical protein
MGRSSKRTRATTRDCQRPVRKVSAWEIAAMTSTAPGVTNARMLEVPKIESEAKGLPGDYFAVGLVVPARPRLCITASWKAGRTCAIF